MSASREREARESLGGAEESYFFIKGDYLSLEYAKLCGYRWKGR